MIISDLPFHIGPTTSPANPPPLPNTLGMEFYLDGTLRLMRQRCTPELRTALQSAYAIGQWFGVPLSEDSAGMPYATDFLAFVHAAIGTPGRALEIGAGMGYLSKALIDGGWTVSALEPGSGYERYWHRYGLHVIPDFFPSRRAPGPFDLVLSYGVLEHLEDPVQALRDMRDHLGPHGAIVLAVPDCTEELRRGDPGMLVHEHLSFFTEHGLASCLAAAGLAGRVSRSGFGRCLYAAAHSVNKIEACVAPAGADAYLDTYSTRVATFIAAARARLAAQASKGTLGFYSAARALALLDQRWPMRFFDDAACMHGRYIVPFDCPIESRDALIARPVDLLVVMSYTFGADIRASLIEHGYSGQVLLIDELVGAQCAYR